MSYNIEWINSTKPTVSYKEQAVAEYKAGIGNGVNKFTAQFEREFNVSGGNDVGGLVIYSENTVYDYENFVGWVK